MGSISRYSALERYLKEHNEELLKNYKEILLGRTVISMSGVECNYYVKCDVTLDNGDVYETHYRWTSQEEDACHEEIPREGEITMKDYYEKYVLNQKISEISIGYDRDDMLYCFAICDTPDGASTLEIPIISVNEIYELEFKKSNDAEEEVE